MRSITTTVTVNTRHIVKYTFTQSNIHRRIYEFCTCYDSELPFFLEMLRVRSQIQGEHLGDESPGLLHLHGVGGDAHQGVSV